MSYRMGNLEEFLDSIECISLLKNKEYHEEEKFSNPESIIAIIGATKLSRTQVAEIAYTYGISDKRLEMCLDYEECKRFNYGKLRNEYKYGAIFVGPIPHKTMGTGIYSSTIEMMKNEPGYPKVYEMDESKVFSGTQLKKVFESFIDDKNV